MRASRCCISTAKAKRCYRLQNDAVSQSIEFHNRRFSHDCARWSFMKFFVFIHHVMGIEGSNLFDAKTKTKGDIKQSDVSFGVGAC
jgi:hypothetical protein